MTADELAERLYMRVQGFEIRTLSRLGKRIKHIGKLTPTELSTLNNIADVRRDMDSVIKDLSTVTCMNIKDVQKVYETTLEENHLEFKPLYDYRGKDFVLIHEDRRAMAMVDAYSRDTAETMINLSRIGAENLGVRTSKGFVPLEKFYTEALDKAVVAVSSGTEPFYSAMHQTIREMGGSNIVVNYDSGYTRRLDSSIRQSLLYGVNQFSREYKNNIGRELGCDGIEIDAHMFPRPAHEFMQGKQYSMVGTVTIDGVKYEDANDATSPVSGESVIESLDDYNCRHVPTPIILGVSVPAFSQEQLDKINEENNKMYTVGERSKTGYGWSQDMRRLETEIRNQKVQREISRSAGANDEVKKCNKRIKLYKEKYNQISDVTGIKGNPQNMVVPKG